MDADHTHSGNAADSDGQIGPDNRWLVVAHLVRPQGRKGELLAELLTEFPERFNGQPRVFLAPSGFEGCVEAARSATVTSFWLPTGKQAGRVVLGLDISLSISDAEQLAGNDILVPISERRPLEEGAVYVHDLVGCQLLDGAELIGTVQDVLALSGSIVSATNPGSATPDAAPVLVVLAADGTEYLIPFARTYLRSVDLAEHRIEMDLPEALLDLYRSSSSSQNRKPNPTESTG